MAKQRTLSEAEEKARKACGGLTRREWRAKHSKFADSVPKTDNGKYEVVAMFEGKPNADHAPMPNIEAAWGRLKRLSTNPVLLSVKIVRYDVLYGVDGKAVGMKPVALYSYTKTGQEFANPKANKPWWDSAREARA